MMRLQLLAQGLASTETAKNISVSGLTADSRKVEPGYLFAAFLGSHVEGVQFVPSAIEAGAVAILCDENQVSLLREQYQDKAFIFGAQEPRQALAQMAARFYGAQPETIVAVTGTAGKTSVAHFTRQVFLSCGFKAASIGTLGVIKPSGETYGGLTTPDPVSLHAQLANLKAEGAEHVALEASSHGLDQYRLDGVQLSAAAFTNLGRDHLDYHASVEDYLQAKLRLFSELLPDAGVVVVDPQEPYGDRVVAAAKQRNLEIFTVGETGEGLRLLETIPDGSTQILTLRSGTKTYKVRFPLIGRFQVANALLAAGLAIVTGIETQDAIAALESLKGVPGRLEFVGESKNGGLVFIDYAHKPDALDHALSALRPFTNGNVLVVIGAGGDRDPGKREVMGAVAFQKANQVIVTDDNPRTEDPAVIRAAILEGAPNALEIADRQEAIATAISRLEKGDILCVAGKGHETGQIIGKTTHPFSDHDAVQRVFELEGNT